MMNWLNTIRWKNLVIIWVSIFVVILPYFHFIITHHLVSEFFWWCILCTSVAAIGNITNDLMDVKQDKENKKKNIFTNPRNKKFALVLIIFLLIISGISVTVSRNQQMFFMLATSALILLTLYNAFLKKVALIGNLLIALLTLMIFIGLDIIAMSRVLFDEAGIKTKQIELLGFFAFLTTLIREILKDAEDRKGDLFAGFRTIAKYLRDKWIAILIIFINVLGCMGIYFFMEWRHVNFMDDLIFYSIWTLMITIGASVIMILPHPSKYVRATRILKSGMLGCLIIYLILTL